MRVPQGRTGLEHPDRRCATIGRRRPCAGRTPSARSSRRERCRSRPAREARREWSAASRGNGQRDDRGAGSRRREDDLPLREAPVSSCGCCSRRHGAAARTVAGGRAGTSHPRGCSATRAAGRRRGGSSRAGRASGTGTWPGAVLRAAMTGSQVARSIAGVRPVARPAVGDLRLGHPRRLRSAANRRRASSHGSECGALRLGSPALVQRPATRRCVSVAHGRRVAVQHRRLRSRWPGGIARVRLLDRARRRQARPAARSSAAASPRP